MAARKRKPPALVPGYERVPGTLRHYRVIATGEELSRRQYQQRARGYVYEKTPKGKTRAGARLSYLSGWADYIRRTLGSFAEMSKTAILRELRRLGLTPPHHGARRKPTRAEAVRQEAFREFIGRDAASFRSVYPQPVEAPGDELV